MKGIIIGILICGFCGASCRKFVSIGTPTDELVSSAVFKDSSTAEAAIEGLYSNIVSYSGLLLNGGFNIYTGMAGDDLTYTATLSDYLEFINNSISITNQYNYNDLWRYGYDYIYQANACIEGVEQSTALSISQQNRLKGESLFIRAMVYFYLVNLYGDIPLELSTDYQVNAVMPRTSQDSVYAKIINDLKESKSLLSENYFTSDRTRANKYAISAFLSKVYLVKKQYADAKAEADYIIASGKFTMSDISSAFVYTSNETILQLYPSNLDNTYNAMEGYLFIPSKSSTSKPNYTINPYLLSSFADDDKRKTSWINSKTAKGITYIYPYKYKIRYADTRTEYNVVIRLAESYLIRAEANYYLGNYSDAVSNLNVIRNRAGLGNFNYTSQGEILTEIMNENRWEFFAEWGHRWIDLKRWGIMEKVLSTEKENYSPTDSVFPIPQQEMLLNPYLTQNSGY